MATKKKVEQPKEEEKVLPPAAPVESPEHDPDLPDNKQRWTR